MVGGLRELENWVACTRARLLRMVKAGPKTEQKNVINIFLRKNSRERSKNKRKIEEKIVKRTKTNERAQSVRKKEIKNQFQIRS